MKNRLGTQRIFFFGMVAVLAVLVLILIWQFTRAILLAVALVIILKPVYSWLLNKRLVKGRESRATAITLIIFIMIIAIPAILIIGGAIIQATRLFSKLEMEGLYFSLGNINVWMEQAIQTIIAGNIHLDEFRFSENISQAIAWLSMWLGNLLVSLGQSLPRLFTNSMVVLVILYVFLPRYKRPGKQEILEIIPFPHEITQLFMDKIDLMIRAMFRGTFLIALAQGLAMGFIFWLVGVPYAMFLTVIAMLLSLVPLIGVSLVAWPVGLILIFSGNVVRGIFVIVAFLIFVAQIDTFLRPRLVPKGAAQPCAGYS